MTVFEIKDEEDVLKYCLQTFYCSHCYFYKKCESKKSEQWDIRYGNASNRLEMFQKIIRRLKLKKLLEK